MSFNGLINGLKVWREIKSESSKKTRERNAAVGRVMDAVLATKAYLYDRENEGINRETERLLSELWQRAAMTIEIYDRVLFQSAQLKALGWSDPREWARAEGREFAIKLDTILEQCAYLRDQSK